MHKTATTSFCTESKMSLLKVFKKFYPDLVQSLPMSDSIFIAALFSDDLLLGNLKAQVKSLPTSADKAMYFLDNVIEPNVKCDNDSSFKQLLGIMEKFHYNEELTNQIRLDIQQYTVIDQAIIPAKSVDGVTGMYCMFNSCIHGHAVLYHNSLHAYLHVILVPFVFFF